MDLIDSHNLPEGAEKQAAVQGMFDAIAPRYDLVNRIMTFRLDVRWRRLSVEALALRGGASVLDLACGTGDFCLELSESGLAPIGIDLSWGMLANNRSSAPLLHGDILSMPMADASVDGAICGFALRNLVELPGFFDELARVVKPGGRIAFLEVSEPKNPVLRFGHGIYFGKVVPFIGGLLSDRSAYQYLPKSVAYLPPTDHMLTRLGQAGFVDVEHTLLSGGIAQLITATRA